MRYSAAAILGIVALCRLAQGGEAAAALGTGDPFHVLFRLLTDFGALGAWLAYMIHQRKKDVDKAAKDSQRWHELDRELVALVRECTTVIAQVMVTLKELRRDIQNRPQNQARTDTDVMKDH